VNAVPISELVLPVRTVNPRERPDAEFTYIDIASVDNYAKAVVNPSRLLGAQAPSRARQRVRTGDVIVATTRPNLNAVALIPSSLDGAICSTGFAVLRPGPSLDPDYLYLFTQSNAFVEPLVAKVAGALYPSTTDRDVRAIPIPLPTIERQQSIAAAMRLQMAATRSLNVVHDDQRKALNGLIEQVYKAAFLSRLPLCASNGPVAPPSWDWFRLASVARLESGHTPSRSRPDWWGGDIPWIQLADIRAVDGQVIHQTLETTNPEGIAHSAARILPADTVVMSRTASVGFVARMGRPMATSQDFVNWVCGPELDPEFLMHLLIRSRDYIRSLSAGAIHQTVYYPTVRDFHVCIPPIDEQRRIAVELRERLATIDAMTRSIHAQREAIDALPAALLRRAFAEIEAA